MKEAIVIPIFALLIPLVVVPTAIVLKYRQRKREWLHQERMRAIELGVPVQTSEHGLGLAVSVVGGGVPIASVLAALITSLNLSDSVADPVPILGVVWGCATMIGGGALVTALLLGFMAARSSRPTVDQAPAFKPAYDPDAYDVVGSRG